MKEVLMEKILVFWPFVPFLFWLSTEEPTGGKALASLGFCILMTAFIAYGSYNKDQRRR